MRKVGSPHASTSVAWGSERQILRRRARLEGAIGQALAGSNEGPSTSSMRAVEQLVLMARAALYSGLLHQLRAASAVGNSRITKRSGFQSPSRAWVVPPRTAYRPPNLAIDAGASCL